MIAAAHRFKGSYLILDSQRMPGKKTNECVRKTEQGKIVFFLHVIFFSSTNASKCNLWSKGKLEYECCCWLFLHFFSLSLSLSLFRLLLFPVLSLCLPFCSRCCCISQKTKAQKRIYIWFCVSFSCFPSPYCPSPILPPNLCLSLFLPLHTLFKLHSKTPELSRKTV